MLNICRRAKFSWVGVALAGAVLGAGCGLSVSSEERLQRAEAALAGGETGAAEVELRSLLRNEPDNGTARALLGELLLDSGRLPAAEKELRRAIELGDRSAPRLYQHAEALLGTGDHAGALSRTEELDGTNPEVMLLRAEALAGLERYDEARRLFRSLDGTPVEPQSRLGMALLVLPDLGAARAELEQAVFIDPTYNNAWLLKGEIEMAAADLTAASASFERILANNSAKGGSDSAELTALYHLVTLRLAEGQKSAADALLTRLDTIAPGHPIRELAEAKVATADRDWPRANTAVRNALKMIPDNSQALTVAGAVSLASANFGQAKVYLNRAIVTDPGNTSARRLLAESELRRADPAEAARLMASGRVDRVDAESQVLLGIAQFESGDAVAAVETLQRSLAANPEDVALIIRTVQVLLANNADAEARDVANRYGASLESEPAVLAILDATFAVRDGDLGAVRKGIDEALAAYPEDARLALAAAQVMWQIGEPDRAIAALEQARGTPEASYTATVLLAELALRQSQLDRASVYLDAVEDQAEDATPGLLRYALLGRLGDYGAAREALANAYRQFPDDNRVAVQYANVLRRHGDTDQASKILEQAALRFPDNVDVLLALASLRGALGEDDAAVDTLRSAADVVPGRLDVKLLLARAVAAVGDTDEAGVLTGELLRSASGMYGARVLELELALETGADETLRLADRLEADFPGNAGATIARARTYLRRDDVRGAINIVKDAIDRDPAGELAIELFELSRIAGLATPERVLDDWLAENPADPSVLLRRAAIHQSVGETQAARDKYERLLDAQPTNYVALNNLAWLLEQDDARQALVYAERAFEVAGGLPSVRDTYGWLLFNSGSVDKGSALLAEAHAAAKQRDGDIAYHVAVAQQRAGATAAAIATLTDALALPGEFSQRATAAALLESLTASN